MSRIEKMKLQIEKMNFSALVSNGDQDDCNIGGSSIFNGHSLGASIGKDSWHFAISQILKNIPEVRGASKKDATQFAIAATALVKNQFECHTIENIQLSHLLLEEDRFDEYGFIELIDGFLPYRAGCSENPRASVSCEIYGRRSRRPVSAGQSKRVPQDAEIDNELVEIIREFVLLIPKSRDAGKCLPVSNISRIFELASEVTAYSYREESVIREFHRVSKDMCPRTALSHIIAIAIEEGLLEVIFHRSSFVARMDEVEKSYGQMLAAWEIPVKQTRHDAESD